MNQKNASLYYSSSQRSTRRAMTASRTPHIFRLRVNLSWVCLISKHLM